MTDYDRLSIHEFADAREKLHRLSIVLQDIIRNREGMPAAGYWMYQLLFVIKNQEGSAT
ncbi:UNVERIFIED_CONTAM: hypothetical protein LBW93_05445 [Wolbachia endosymbiont of Nasonia longicornis]